MSVTKLISSASGFYMAGSGFSNTFRVELRLRRAVDGDMLRHAVDAAMPRYPYFSVRTAVENETYVLLDNDLPVPVTQGIEPVCLGSKEANYHLIALAYEGEILCFDVFHGLTDGCGILPFIKTVLYFYLCEREQVRLDSAGIRLPGEEIPAEEIDDPYPASVPDDIEPFGAYRPGPMLRVEGSGNPNRAERTAYYVRIPENAFIKYSKAQDGSPATMLSVFMSKAIAALNPGMRDPIVCGMALNMRPALGKPLAHNSLVSQVHLAYTPELLKDPVTKLATCSRGMVMIQSEPENVWIFVRNALKLLGYFGTMTHEQKKQMMQTRALQCLGSSTFSVSYVGRAGWGALEPYLAGAHIYTDITALGLFIELMAVGGWFDCCFMQEFPGDQYVRQFASELEKEGIACQVEGPYPVRIAGFTA